MPCAVMGETRGLRDSRAKAWDAGKGGRVGALVRRACVSFSVTVIVIMELKEE